MVENSKSIIKNKKEKIILPNFKSFSFVPIILFRIKKEIIELLKNNHESTPRFYYDNALFLDNIYRNIFLILKKYNEKYIEEFQNELTKKFFEIFFKEHNIFDINFSEYSETIILLNSKFNDIKYKLINSDKLLENPFFNSLASFFNTINETDSTTIQIKKKKIKI